MFPIESYLEKWNLRNPEEVAITPSSSLFKVSRGDQFAVLKLFTQVGMSSEGNSPVALRYFSGKGSVKVLEQDIGALLLEYVDGPKLTSLVENGNDVKASQIICDVLGDLHRECFQPAPGIGDLKTRFESLFKYVETCDSKSIYSRTAKVAQYLLNTETDKTLLHGDMHHSNILRSSSRGWISIDPQPLFGEKTYDFANAFFNPDNLPKVVESRKRVHSMADIFASRLGVSQNRVLKFAYAHGGLSAFLQVQSGQDPRRRLRIIAIIESLL